MIPENRLSEVMKIRTSALIGRDTCWLNWSGDLLGSNNFLLQIANFP